jgi:hypothetical protein
MRVSLKMNMAIALMCLLAVPALAARKEKPSGAEIAGRARSAVLDSANTMTGEKSGKKIKLTPATLDQVKSESDLEQGQFMGVLETEALGDETGLPPGKYNLFAAKVGNEWHVYAESGGTIVAEAVHIRAEKQQPGIRKKPEFRAQGWCWWVPVGFWGFWFCL